MMTFLIIYGIVVVIGITTMIVSVANAEYAPDDF